MRQTDSTPDLPKPVPSHVNLVIKAERRRNVLRLPGYIEVGGKVVEVKSLLDTGANVIIISNKLVERYHLPTVKLPRALTFRNADDSINKKGNVTHRVEGHLRIKGYKLPTRWYVAELGHDDIILGMPWIRRYNPQIDWQNGKVRFAPSIIRKWQKVNAYQRKTKPPEGSLWGLHGQTKDLQVKVISFIEDPPSDIEEDQLTHRPSQAINHLWNNILHIRKTNISTEIAIAANKDKPDIPLEELVPAYAKQFTKVFEKHAADRFPPSRT